MKDIVVIYHGECIDGFGGAWSAWKKFGETAGYIGVSHGEDPPEGLAGKEIYFIDFVYPRIVMESLKQNNKKITIIDHHKTAMDTIELADSKSFDIDHSGAVLAWRYFHPDKEMPSILKYIEDRDMWRWEISGSKEVLAYFDLFDLNFDVWDDIVGRFDNDESVRKEFHKNGELLLRQWNSLCDKIIDEDAMLVEFEGYQTFAVNAPSIFSSDLGNLLSKKLPPIAILWHQNKDGSFGTSLRSDGSVDVSEIAKKYGGGGHKAAAGFRISSDRPFPWKLIGKNNNE